MKTTRTIMMLGLALGLLTACNAEAPSSDDASSQTPDVALPAGLFADAAPDGGPTVLPTGLRPPLARHFGCLWLDDSAVVDLTVTSECTLETEGGCELRCDEPLERIPSTCVLPAGEAEHAEAEVCLPDEDADVDEDEDNDLL